MEISTDAFSAFQILVRQQIGIHLKEGKQSLLKSRLAKRLRTLGMESVDEYLAVLRGPDARHEMQRFIDAITTNTTSFFREPESFTIFMQQVDRWHDAGQRRFRFWCAAASTGEEPYTIAMLLHDRFRGQAEVDWKLLATDINLAVLETCRTGRYEQRDLANVPEHLRKIAFTRDGQGYRAIPAIRDRIVFNRLNLIRQPWPMKGPLDAVFCRNVMIYFDEAVRRELLLGISRLLRPGGFLFVGHSESLSDRLGIFRTIRPSVYVKE